MYHTDSYLKNQTKADLTVSEELRFFAAAFYASDENREKDRRRILKELQRQVSLGVRCPRVPEGPWWLLDRWTGNWHNYVDTPLVYVIAVGHPPPGIAGVYSSLAERQAVSPSPNLERHEPFGEGLTPEIMAEIDQYFVDIEKE